MEKPSNMQFRIAEIIEGVYTDGVLGTTTRDTTVLTEGTIEEKSSTNSPALSTASGNSLTPHPKTR